LFTDYCCGPKPWSDEFSDYVRERGYSLHTTEEYRELVAGAGFEQVVAEDLTARFRAILQVELERIETLPIADAVRAKLRLAWQHKLRRAEAQEQRWALISALKEA
jgi:phosphoethanolamine N-methyltransferase